MLINSRGDNHLVVRPDVLQWAIVNDTGLDIAKLLFDEGFSVSQVVSSLSADYTKEDVEEMCQELLSLFQASTDEIFETTKSLTSKTTIAMIALTDVCNLECPHCYVDANTDVGQELSLSEHRVIANKLKEQLATNIDTKYGVALTGGEPFLKSDIVDIIKAYQSEGLGVTISTNGLLITEDQARFLADSDVSISISLDGPNAGTHDMIRGEGNFDRVIDQINMIVDCGVRVGINHLVHEANFDHLEETITLAYELGCNGFNPMNLVQLGRACDSPLKRVLETQIFKRIADHLVANPEELFLFEKTSLFSSMGAALLSGVTCSSCGLGERPCVYIDSIGRVFPCANTQNDRFLLGNVRDKSLSDILPVDHPILQELRLLKVDTLNDKCSKCQVRSFCGGDCRGETYGVTGDIRAPYVACQDRHDSIIEMMWIVAEYPELFETRANEFTFNAHLSV
ncbi:MAG: radical SAM protein [Candidatus Saccharibacteria bacterium]